MAALVDDLRLGVSEAGTDGADELLGHERIGAAADDEHRTVECAVSGRVAHPTVPDIDVVGNHLGSDGDPKVGEPIELSVCEVGGQFCAEGALGVAVAAEGTERGDNLLGKLGPAQWYRSEQDEP